MPFGAFLLSLLGGGGGGGAGLQGIMMGPIEFHRPVYLVLGLLAFSRWAL